ncbi:MAG: AmmeMemoRadiSam system protein B, partial [Chloroflexi bacterium]|nr:AmmeMemoRadiSam system protein B [Chloroflexota bacterium]
MANSHPKLRPLDVRPGVEQGHPHLLLRDPLALSPHTVMVPRTLGMLLALLDGTRDVPTLASAYALRTGFSMTVDTVQQVVDGLSEALLLEDERSAEAYAAARREYLEAPFRKPALAGLAYPEDPVALAESLRGYCDLAPPEESGAGDRAAPVLGIISPHIDYQRGGPVYGSVWQRAARAIEESDLVIVFGTDHAGGPGKLTLTRQDYATPWGPLPTARPIVDALADVLGEEEVFEEELHHRNEHSIELALVWLHYMLGARSVEVVPILCGSFHGFIAGDADPALWRPFDEALGVLREAASERRTLVIAAADLAHVGPAFGDDRRWDDGNRAALRSADEALLRAISAGDADAFFGEVKQVSDRYRICGMPPIYLTLRLLG